MIILNIWHVCWRKVEKGEGVLRYHSDKGVQRLSKNLGLKFGI